MNELINEVFDLSRDAELEEKLEISLLTKKNVELCLREKGYIKISESKILLNVTSTYRKLILAQCIKDATPCDFRKEIYEIMHMNNLQNQQYSPNKRRKL